MPGTRYFGTVVVLHIIVYMNTSREVHEARLPRTCSRPCAFEVKKTKKKKRNPTRH